MSVLVDLLCQFVTFTFALLSLLYLHLHWVPCNENNVVMVTVVMAVGRCGDGVELLC